MLDVRRPLRFASAAPAARLVFSTLRAAIDLEVFVQPGDRNVAKSVSSRSCRHWLQPLRSCPTGVSN